MTPRTERFSLDLLEVVKNRECALEVVCRGMLRS